MKKYMSVIMIMLMMNVFIPFEAPQADTWNDAGSVFVPFDEKTNIDLYWGWNLFNIDSSEYSHDIAMAGAVLSQAAELGQQEAADRLYALGFDHVASIWYDGSDYDTFVPAMMFGSQKITINDEEKILIVTVVRGSGDTGDWITDFCSQIDGFFTAAGNVEKAFIAYHDKVEEIYGVELTLNNTILFITGHSLGGAMAGQLGRWLDGIYASRDKIFDYTYASPAYQTFKYNTEQFVNIHNIINTSDIVPSVPLGYKRYGHDWYYESDMGNIADNHILITYLTSMLNELPSNMGDGAVNNYSMSNLHYRDEY